MDTTYRISCLLLALLAVLSAKDGDAANIPIQYKLAKDGEVSMAIYDKSGRMVRRLHVGAAMTTGDHTAHWDGLDDSGRPVPLGTYEWRLANSSGIHSQYLTSLGTSDGYWHWPGAHEGPGSVEVVGDTVIMAAHLVEGSPQYIAWDLKTGKVKWHQKPASGFAWLSDLALGGQTLFANGFSIGKNQPELLLLDAKTGKYVLSWSTWKRALFSFLPIARYEAQNGSGKPKGPILDAQVYDKSRGRGWMNATGIRPRKVGDHAAIGSTQTRSATFRIDLPKYNVYRTAVVVGNPTDRPRKIEVTIANRRSKHTLQLKPGETKRIENKRGNQNLTIEIRNPKGEPVGWAVQSIVVHATPRRIAAHGDTLVALLPDNSVVWIDPRKGKKLFQRPFTVHHQTHVLNRVTLKLNEPGRDIEVLPNGKVVVLTSEKLVEVNKDGKVVSLISDLCDASRVSADAKTGDVFVVEHGESHQIKVYAPTFRRKNTFGRKGGRRQGRYDPTDFYKVEDIAGDGHGGFVIVEQRSAPRRTAHFNGQGKLVREWYGAQTFSVHSWHDPKQPNHVWFDNGHGWVTEAVVDYDKGSWRPYATYKIARVGGKKLNIQVQHTGYLGFHIRYHKGHKYLCKVRDPVVLRVDEKNRRIVPVVKYYSFAFNQYTITKDRVPGWVLTPQEARKHRYIGFLWTDLNGDGEPQKDEVRLSKKNFSAGDSWIDEDMTYYTNNGYVAKPTWKNGIPVYPLPAEAKKQVAGANWRDEKGNYYQQCCGGHLNIHGFGWPSTMVAANLGLKKYSADGKTLLFDVGNKAVTWPGTHPEGQLHFPVKIAGIVRGVVGVAQRVGAPVEFWTTDGLYVGQLFNGHGTGPEIAYHWWRVNPKKNDSWGRNGNQAVFQYDMAAGGRLVQYKGEVYYFGAGWNNVPTYRLSGFGKIRRQKGVVQLATKAAPATGTGTGLTARYYADGSTKGQPVLTRVERQVDLGQFGNYKKMPKNAVGWPKPLPGQGKDKFSVRLTGFIEPRLTDTYTFFVYGGPADVYINDKKVLARSTAPTPRSGARYRSQSIRLEAGQKVPIRIEARRTQKQALYLSWETKAFTAEIVPGKFLYPQKEKK